MEGLVRHRRLEIVIVNFPNFLADLLSDFLTVNEGSVEVVRFRIGEDLGFWEYCFDVPRDTGTDKKAIRISPIRHNTNEASV